MNPTHREFFIKLRALCDEYQAKIEPMSEDAFRFVVGSGTADVELYENSGMAPRTSIHLRWAEHVSLPPSEEPQP